MSIFTQLRTTSWTGGEWVALLCPLSTALHPVQAGERGDLWEG
jgi:hypothetical protein